MKISGDEKNFFCFTTCSFKERLSLFGEWKIRIPRPPPPKAALIINGNPCEAEAFNASLSPGVTAAMKEE